MNAQHFKFTFNCPNCGEVQTTSTANYGDIDGDVVDDCVKCGKRYVVRWSIELETEVFKCDNTPSPDDNMTVDISCLGDEFDV